MQRHPDLTRNMRKCRGQETEPAMYNVTPHMRHGTTKMITEKPREKEADKERLRELAAFNKASGLWNKRLHEDATKDLPSRST